MTSSLPTFLLVVVLVITNANDISCNQDEHEPIQTARFEVSKVLNWAKGLKTMYDFESNLTSFDSYRAGFALSQCVMIYKLSERRLTRLVSSSKDRSHRKAITWLNAALAGNRDCLDGLERNGFSFDTKVARNLNIILEKALDSVADEQGVTGRGRIEAFSSIGTSSKGPDWGLLGSWNPQSSKAHFVVAQDGSGNYNTINQAIDAASNLGLNRPNRIVIYIKSGVYNEQVNAKLTNLMLVGDGIDRTIITCNKYSDQSGGTPESATFGIYGDGFWARGITFENTAGPGMHQAVALSVRSDHAVIYHCSMKGYQDTLLVWYDRQFFRDCQIHGTIDFIFGYASAVFQNCDIFVREPAPGQDNIITAQGRGNSSENTGIVIIGSRVLPDSDFGPYKHSVKSYLGRPWYGYARVVFIKTYLDDLVSPEGWGDLYGDYHSTVCFGEYGNRGPGSGTQDRVKWEGVHVFHRGAEVSAFSVRNFIQGHQWLPAAGVPYSLDI